MQKPILYLIPNTLGAQSPIEILSPSTLKSIHSLTSFIAENAKTARAFLKEAGHPVHPSGMEIIELDKHHKNELEEVLELLAKKNNTGLISEAGMPCIADPGAEVVNLAIKQNFRIVPLSGPSSIFLALTASGLNGQQFIFHGYLPVQSAERKEKIKELDQELKKTGFTQIFIETPYRNDGMLQDILNAASLDIRLCIAASLMQDDETILTRKISAWKNETYEIGKRPCMFLLGK
ncbi:MAG: SAM-dependent methyltransferase [Bacteroidia bacterium]|nr:SAM-dependent methyltransferase [Bacteroidia bacterium]